MLNSTQLFVNPRNVWIRLKCSPCLTAGPLSLAIRLSRPFHELLAYSKPLLKRKRRLQNPLQLVQCCKIVYSQRFPVYFANPVKAVQDTFSFTESC